MTITTETLEVTIDDRAAMDSCLDAAVNRMIEVALQKGRYGLLVTRRGDKCFTVALSETVPFGYTEQLDDRNKSRSSNG